MDTLKRFESLHPASPDFAETAKILRASLGIIQGTTMKAIHLTLSRACDSASVEIPNKTFHALVKAVHAA